MPMAQLPMAMANLMICCLLVVGPAVLPIGSTYPRPHSLGTRKRPAGSRVVDSSDEEGAHLDSPCNKKPKS